MVAGLGISALLSAGLILLIRHFASSLHLIDEPNYRSSHTHPVPRGAGIAFTLAALAALYFSQDRLVALHGDILLALFSVLAIGILDDRHEAAPRTKFVVLLFATFLIWREGLRIDDVGRYFGFEIHLALLSFPFTYFAVAGFTNAMNLIDGIDGLAGSIVLLILTFFLILGYRHHDTFLISFSLFFIVGVTVFLYFNWHPASIFMGDSGSLVLGFVISILSIYSLKYIPSVAVLYLGAFPIVDTLVAMFRRKMQKYSVTQPDRCHIHHLLFHITGSIPQTVIIIVGVQFLFLLVAFFLPKNMDQGIALLLFFLILTIAYKAVLFTVRRYRIPCYRNDSSTKD